MISKLDFPFLFNCLIVFLRYSLLGTLFARAHVLLVLACVAGGMRERASGGGAAISLRVAVPSPRGKTGGGYGYT